MHKHKLYLTVSLVLGLLFTLSITGNAQSSDKIVYDDGLDIFVMNVDGSGIQQLTSGHNSKESRIRPDGTEIVFVSDRDGNNEIYVMDIMGNNIRRLTNNSVRDFSPSWSPDGTKIAYVSGMNADFDIYTMNADGSNAINLTNSNANEVYAVWSPTSDQIAFISNQSGPYEIYTMLADGSNYEHLSDAGSDLVTRFEWSPDGTRLTLYNGQIYQISADGTQEAPITFGEADIGRINWLNNQQLIFTDTVNGWVRIDLDGSNRTVVNLDWPRPAGNFSFPANMQLPIPPANSPPTADAGDDQMVVAANGVAAQVRLTASASDPEDEIKQLSWYEDGQGLGGGLNPHELDIELEVGVHLLTLVATDSRGLTGSDEVVITVVAPPSIQVNVISGSLIYVRDATEIKSLQYVTLSPATKTVFMPQTSPDTCSAVSTNGIFVAISDMNATDLKIYRISSQEITFETAWISDWLPCSFVWSHLDEGVLLIRGTSSTPNLLALDVISGQINSFEPETYIEPDYSQLPDWIPGIEALQSPIDNIFLYQRCANGQIVTHTQTSYCDGSANWVIYDVNQQTDIETLQSEPEVLEYLPGGIASFNWNGLKWSPNGQYLSYIEETRGRFALRIYDVISQQYLELPLGAADVDKNMGLHWSLDGTKISVWVKGRLDEPQHGDDLSKTRRLIFIDVGAEFSQRVQIADRVETFPENMVNVGIWSPDNQSFVFIDGNKALVLVSAVNGLSSIIDTNVQQIVTWK